MSLAINHARTAHSVRSLLTLLGVAALPALALAQRAPSAGINGVELAPIVIVPHQQIYHLSSRTPAMPFTGRVVVQSVSTKIDIVEQVATTDTELQLLNQGSQPLEAELMLPVPEGATVRSFSYEGAGGGERLKILPWAEAKRIYEAIVAESRDPGLLEFAGYNAIRSSVFPIAPGRSLRVWLSYEQLLTADGDRIDYVLPRSESLAHRGTTWRLNATIRSKRPISTVYAPSHNIVQLTRDPNTVTLQLADRAAEQPGSFRLSYLVERGQLSASLLAYPDPSVGGGYFLLLASVPRQAGDGPRDERNREITLVLDRSGSMRGEKFEQARASAIQVLEGLRTGESFNIIDFSTAVSQFAAGPVDKNATTMADAVRYLNSLDPDGGTNIHGALLDALRAAPRGDMLPLVLFLTDGLPTTGIVDEARIRDDVARANTRNRRIFTFGVGYDVNAPLLDKLAEASRGASVNVLPGENIELAVSSVFRRLEGPALEAPQLTALNSRDAVDTQVIFDAIPAALPDLFNGDQLVVLGKYRGNRPIRLRLQGQAAGAPRTYEFQFSLENASSANSFVPRLWATRRISTLVDAVRQLGASGPSAAGSSDPRVRELVDEIVSLSSRFGVLTEYTAFLATDGVAGPNMTMQIDKMQVAQQAEDLLRDRAVTERSGRGAINQSMNIKGGAKSSQLNFSNRYLDQEMREVEFTGVQQIADQALFRRGNRWVDARIMTAANRAAETPDRSIDFATAEYFEFAAQLAAEGRAAMISLPGEVYVEYAGKRVLVRNPETPLPAGS